MLKYLTPTLRKNELDAAIVSFLLFLALAFLW